MRNSPGCLGVGSTCDRGEVDRLREVEGRACV